MRDYILIFIFFILVVACNNQAGTSNDLDSHEFTNLSPEKVYSEKDFNVTGVKINKSYDVSKLPMATSAMRMIFDSKYVEARLYETANTANNEGKLYAESVTGPEAIVSGNSVMWKEKARDRRKCIPPADRSAGCQHIPYYGGFIVSGNLVLLCEGLDDIEANDLCLKLIKHLLVNR